MEKDKILALFTEIMHELIEQRIQNEGFDNHEQIVKDTKAYLFRLIEAMRE